MKMKKGKKLGKILLAVFVVLLVGAFSFCAWLYTHGLLAGAHNNSALEQNQIKVACVGDSVTYGMNMPNWSKNAYPFVLREMLGSDYCVQNFGFSGRTVSTLGNKPYTNEDIYRQSLEFKPDIVVLQIGSNDSKSYNWKGKENFSKDYEALLESYESLESKPVIFVCTPPPAFAVNGKVKYDIEPQTITDEIAPAIRAIAKKHDLCVIDLEELFDSKPELFLDGLHPNPEGAKLFANTVFEQIKKLKIIPSSAE